MGRYVTLTKDLPDEVRIAHPICVLKKLREMGVDPRTATREQKIEAARRCIAERKLHGIAKLLGLGYGEVEGEVEERGRMRTVVEYPKVQWIKLRRVFKVGREWEGSYEIHENGRIHIDWRGLGYGLSLTVNDLKTYPRERIVSFMVEQGMRRDQAERLYDLLIKDVRRVFGGI